MLKFVILSLFFINDIIKADNIDDFQYYFQIYPSQNKEKSYLFHVYTPNYQFLTIDTTKDEKSSIIENKKINEYLYNNISKILLYNETLLIKTCFGPDIIVEIINEKNETFFHKKNKADNYLNNIKYCYSTVVNNSKEGEIWIITYWVEKEVDGNYHHKSVIFYPKTKKFKENEKEYELNTNIKNLNNRAENIEEIKDNIYPESCVTFRGEDIYCSVHFDSRGYQKFGNSYIIEAKKIPDSSNLPSITLVSSSTSFDNTIYHKPISIGFTLNWLYDIFLTEYHDKINDKTRLISSSFIKLDNFYYSKISLSQKSYLGINIEDRYIEPSLFNSLIPNINDLIIIYIMKNANQKMSLIMSRFNLINSITKYSSFTKYSLSHYYREDICLEPKYIQSIFINSLINYDDKDNITISNNKNQKYYKYQRDIVSFISCSNTSNHNSVYYQTKKINMPQCLNILDEINDISYSELKFKDDNIILDIYNDPYLYSLRNNEIEFINTNIIYNDIIKIKLKTKNNNNYIDIDYTKPVSNVTHIKLELLQNINNIILGENKYLSLSYRLKKTESNNNSISCLLVSDICKFKLNLVYNNTGKKCNIKYCLYCERIDNNCAQCNTSQIEGLILKDNECVCDINKNMMKKPNETINMCICKKNYSFYKNKSLCLSNDILENGPYVINTTDDISLIPIYDDCHSKCKKCYRSDFTEKEMFCTECYDNYYLDSNNNCILKPDIPIESGDVCLYRGNLARNKLWFKMGEYKFYYAKISDCILVFDSNFTLFFYSNKSNCLFNENKIKYISDCLDIKDLNLQNYQNSLIDSKEYNYSDTEIKISNKYGNITFYLVNGQSNIPNYSDLSMDKECIKTLKNTYNISENLKLLIFKADIIRNDTISTQVEYQFYNPIPNKINIKLDLNKCKNYKVNLSVPIHWKNEQREIVEELYCKKKIYIFDTSIDFYNDICNQYKSKEGSDVYLEERKKYYYINEAFCEEGCDLINDENYELIDKLMCQCPIKNTTEKYNLIKFIQEKDGKFKKKVILPNIQVLKCFGKAFKNQLNNFGFYFILILLIIFVLSYVLRFKICRKLPFYYEIPIKKVYDKILKETKKIEKEEESNNYEENGEEKPEHYYNKDLIINKNEMLEENPIKRRESNPLNNSENVSLKQEDINNEIKTEIITSNNGTKYNFKGSVLPMNQRKIKNENNEKNIEIEKSVKSESNLIDSSNNESNYKKNKEENNGGNEENKKENKNKHNKSQSIDEEEIIFNNDKKEDKKTNKDKKSENTLDVIFNKNKKELNSESKSSKKIFNQSVSSMDKEYELNNSDSISGKIDELNNKNVNEKEDIKDEQNIDNLDLNDIMDEKNQSQNPKNQNEIIPKKKNNFTTNSDNTKNIKKKKKKRKKNNQSNPPKKSQNSNILVKPVDNDNNENDKNYLSKSNRTSFISSQQEEDIKKKNKEENGEKLSDKELSTIDKKQNIIKKVIKAIKAKFYKNYSLDMLNFDEAVKNKKDQRGFCLLFFSMIMNNNIIFFGIPFIDENDLFTKASVLILTLNLYIFLNIIFMFNSSSLHLYIGHIFQEKFEKKYFYINILIPFLLYIPALVFKKLTSLREILINKEEEIETIKENKDKKKFTKRILNLHDINTKISQFKNSLDIKAKWIFIGGGIFLLFNWFLTISFCGIYNNSIRCLALHTFISILFTIIIWSLLFLVSTIFRKLGISKRNQLLYNISAILNPTYLLYGSNRNNNQ